MKKGFTLAEILGVIVIIGILLVLIVPAVINRITESEDEVKGATGNIIYDAADQYIREHPDLYPPGQSGRYCITIKSLIDDGKLVEPVIDPTTGDDISDKSVMVTIYTSGTSDFELTEKDTCEETSAVPFIDFDVTPKGSSWVKLRTVKIIWPKMDGDYKARYRINNDKWEEVNINSYNGGTTELIFDESSAKTPLEAQYVGKGEDTTSITSSRINIVNIDSIAPKCTLSLSGTEGDNDWYKSNVTVSFGENNKNLTDNLSGIEDYAVSTNSAVVFGKIASKVQTADTSGVKYYGFVMDKAGNIGNCEISFKKDSTKPTCEMSESGTKGDNDWYISDVKFNVVNSDNLSGVAQNGMNNKNTVNYNGATTMTLSQDAKSITYYGFVKDKAGNTNQCSRNVKRDVTKPSCKITPSGQGGNNNWYKGIVTMTLSSYTDATSGIATYGLNNNSSVNYNKTTKLTQTADTSGITYYGFVKDNAGNTNQCTSTIKKDSTAPSCKITPSGTPGNNGWYISDVKFTMTTNDNLSGVYQKGMNSTNSTNYNNSTSMVLKNDTAGKTYYGFVKDQAGNTATCSNSAKRDVTAPSCNISINSSSSQLGEQSWYRSNVTVDLSRSDGTSGVDTYGVSTSSSADYNGKTSATHTSDTTGVTYYGYVKDKAGNTCKKSINFKKDSTKPYTPYAYNPKNANNCCSVSNNTCNGSRVNCSFTVTVYCNGWQYVFDIIKEDVTSKVKDTYVYHWPSKNDEKNETDYCNWVTNCGFKAHAYPPFNIDLRFRVTDNAGNVSDTTYVDVSVKQG